jgi:HEAT repeat protein
MPKNAFKLELRTPKLRSWLEHGLAHLVERVKSKPWGAELERFGNHVQRFGGTAWDNIATRWPALGELVRDRKLVSARYRPSATTALQPEAPLSGVAIDAMLAQLVGATSWQSRASAAMSLAHVESDGVVPALVRALRDPSVEVAVAAVDALTSHYEPDSTQALLQVLGNPEGFFNPITRVAAITGLARRLAPTEFNPVFAAVRDIDAEVCIAAIAVIAERVPQLAGEQLLPILRDPTGYYLPLVRLAAANALERAGVLTGGLASEFLRNESDPALRRVFDRAKFFASA